MISVARGTNTNYVIQEEILWRMVFKISPPSVINKFWWLRWAQCDYYDNRISFCRPVKRHYTWMPVERYRQQPSRSIPLLREARMMPIVIFMVFYLSTRLAGCSVDPEISCGTCKLARIPQVTKQKKKMMSFVLLDG
jgi:hypothetical protein